jgi:peptidoglycan DL-endopeptidase CwlO
MTTPASPTTTPRRRRPALCLAVLATLVTVLAATAVPAAANPQGDADGAPQTLQAALDAAAHAYVDAKAKLDASKLRQVLLEQKMKESELRLALLQEEVQWVAVAAYRGGRMSVAMALLDTGSADGMLQNATTVQYLAERDDRAIHELALAKRRYAQQRDQLGAEIKLQQQQVAEMEKRKQEAERALGRASPTSGFVKLPATATPAPRNPDGSWPVESCSVDDPTTSGCLTPRTLHALQQARAAGFTRYTACYRPGTWGEHPKGRACDFSATTSGFANVRAYGDSKAYGDRLASWFMANADRLAVLYVIWYKQIWFPGLGWRAYSGDGTVAGDHYNHVHLSVH